MERFTSPIVTVLALYGLWTVAVNFGWLKMFAVKFPNFQQNPIVKTIETQIKKDLQQGTGGQLPTATPSPTASPLASPSPLVGVGGNVQTPFFSGEYNFKLGGSNGKQQQQQQQPKQPDNRAPNR